MTAAFSIGFAGGDMTDLVVSPQVSVANGRGTDELVTFGGTRWFQRARKNLRSWSVGRPWQQPQFARLLSLAAHGLGGDVLLYDRACARQNMIPVSRSTGDGPAVTVAGVPMGSVTWKTLTVPLIPGRTYTVSVWTDFLDGDAPLIITPPGGVATPMPRPAQNTGGRLSVFTFTPTVKGHVALATTTFRVSGVRVHEGVPDGTYYATEGTPCSVAVKDPERTYQLVLDRETRIDYQVELLEVGLFPGVMTT